MTRSYVRHDSFICETCLTVCAVYFRYAPLSRHAQIDRKRKVETEGEAGRHTELEREYARACERATERERERGSEREGASE